MPTKPSPFHPLEAGDAHSDFVQLASPHWNNKATSQENVDRALHRLRDTTSGHLIDFTRQYNPERITSRYLKHVHDSQMAGRRELDAVLAGARGKTPNPAFTGKDEGDTWLAGRISNTPAETLSGKIDGCGVGVRAGLDYAKHNPRFTFLAGLHYGHDPQEMLGFIRGQEGELSMHDAMGLYDAHHVSLTSDPVRKSIPAPKSRIFFSYKKSLASPPAYAPASRAVGTPPFAGQITPAPFAAPTPTPSPSFARTAGEMTAVPARGGFATRYKPHDPAPLEHALDALSYGYGGSHGGRGYFGSSHSPHTGLTSHHFFEGNGDHGAQVVRSIENFLPQGARVLHREEQGSSSGPTSYVTVQDASGGLHRIVTHAGTMPHAGEEEGLGFNRTHHLMQRGNGILRTATQDDPKYQTGGLPSRYTLIGNAHGAREHFANTPTGYFDMNQPHRASIAHLQQSHGQEGFENDAQLLADQLYGRVGQHGRLSKSNPSQMPLPQREAIKGKLKELRKGMTWYAKADRETSNR